MAEIISELTLKFVYSKCKFPMFLIRITYSKFRLDIVKIQGQLAKWQPITAKELYQRALGKTSPQLDQNVSNIAINSIWLNPKH